MSSLTSSRSSAITGDIRVPGDKSISHRTAILGGLAEGTTEVRNFLCSEDCLNTLKAMQAMGVEVEVLEELEGYGPTHLRIHGRAGKLVAPDKPVDCGNSGTGMRLLAGLLAAQPFDTTLIGDESLSGRPMGRIMRPLAEMGARILAKGESEGCAPLQVFGGSVKATHYELPMASAQVKSCVLLAGLFADGKTTVVQPAATRDHTERLFSHFQLPIEVDGNTISTEGGKIPVAKDLIVPGDVSSAAFWMVAAAIVPGSDLTIRDVGLNPTRDAVIGVLQRMGADITVTPTGGEDGEPLGDIRIKGSNLKGVDILPDEVPILIDEIPVISVAATQAKGVTRIREAEELRVKETDRIDTTVKNLRAMGAEVEEFEDGLHITGGATLKAATMESFGDHRIAMAFLVAGLVADGTTEMHGVECITTSYPGFAQQFASLTNPV